VRFIILIYSNISTLEVINMINKLLIRKISDLNKILNKILKLLDLKILLELTQNIYIALARGSLLSYYRESITVILRKKSKKNYSLLDSYRLIALENILAKIIEKVLITYLSLAIKEHILLL